MGSVRDQLRHRLFVEHFSDDVCAAITYLVDVAGFRTNAPEFTAADENADFLIAYFGGAPHFWPLDRLAATSFVDMAALVESEQRARPDVSGFLRYRLVRALRLLSYKPTLLGAVAIRRRVDACSSLIDVSLVASIEAGVATLERLYQPSEMPAGFDFQEYIRRKRLVEARVAGMLEAVADTVEATGASLTTHSDDAGGKAVSQAADAYLSPREIAASIDRSDFDAVRKTLERWREANKAAQNDTWIEVADSNRRQAKYLYRLSAARQILKSG